MALVWNMAISALKEPSHGFAAQNSRWFTIEALSRHQKHLRTTTLLLLILLGFKRGYWRTWDEAPLLGGDQAAEPIAAEPDEAAQPSEATNPVRMSMAKSRQEVQKEISKIPSFQYAAKILSQRSCMQSMDGMEYIEWELDQIFRKGMTMCHTQFDWEPLGFRAKG